VIMPGMQGTELVEEAGALRPGIPVLFMSGYSHEVLAPQALTEKEGHGFIEKPFSSIGLLKAIRPLVDKSGYGSAEHD
jgi:two-component system cell cycle sensor histidine kinase/response regulator CckA